MNAKVKGLFVIIFHLLILFGIALLWLNSIREQRSLHSNKVKIQIIKPSEENELITEKEIQNHLKLFYKRDYRKIKIRSLNTKELESYLNKLHVVRYANVYIDAGQNLRIDLYQRDPVVRVIDLLGNQFYIDAEGRKIPNSENYAARVPVATGIIAKMEGNDIWKKQNIHYQSAFKIAQRVAADPFTKSLIEQINLDFEGNFILIPKIGSEKIILGNIENLNDKLEKLKFFYKEGLRYKGWNVYEEIDLKNNNIVVGRKHQSET
ncbi:MAG: hypothetical protein M3Q56_03655 [Bacteroidota bacterium]|nr:hypothetical protein [Bacteroidota bacterium]